MAKKTDGKIGFHIETIENLGSNFKKPEKPIPTERIDFSLSHNFNLTSKGQKIEFVLQPKYSYGKRKSITIAEFLYKITFAVEGLEQFHVKDEEYKIPDGLIVTLFSISYSTLRGIIYEKGRGTILERIITPIIDPKIVLQKNEAEN